MNAKDAAVDRLEGVLAALDGIVLYRGIRTQPVIKSFEGFMRALVNAETPNEEVVRKYYDFLSVLCGEISWNSDNISWVGYLTDEILSFETAFSLQAEKKGYDGLSPALLVVAAHDLALLKRIIDVPWKDVIDLLEERTGRNEILDILTPADSAEFQRVLDAKGLREWSVVELAEYYRRRGSGIFGVYRGFRWCKKDGKGYLQGIHNVDPITLDQLVGYEVQKAKLIENTEQFINGYPANNVLLYGDRGTGKSSMVKALLHRFGDRGLRIIEVPKAYLDDYYEILNQLEGRAQKFIIFIDDLSFEDTEVEYKHIKALLEGGLKARPSNVLIYATSNRRHLIRETQDDRADDYNYNDRGEISPTDSMQEKLSLSDRFGITLIFTAPDQKGYLKMVESIARMRGLTIDSQMENEALEWEKRYNGRSGRTARQFVDYLEGKLNLRAQP